MKTKTKKGRCGCIYNYEESVIKDESKYRKTEYTIKIWRIETHCSKHYPNFKKKAEKFIHRKDKKTGRGFTKSPKPLKERK